MVEQVPRVLAGRYEVGELIGRGGMAEVHIGRDNRLSRRVAIKLLRSDLAQDSTFQARFRREAQSAAALNHPAIVSVYDTGEDVVTGAGGAEQHVPFIVMEYVEGHTVRELLREGTALPIDEAVEITSGVLSALEYSHHAGIIHRDIKPANVMITTAGDVKVMDFGIARAVADSAATMTQTQAVVGTAQYLSPEQARGEVVDARSDVYSTGALLFELLTGRPPFIGDSPVAVAYQHVREEPPTPSALAPDVPGVLDRIVLKALAKDRTVRYQSAEEFRADLEAARRGGAVGAPAVGVIAAANAAHTAPAPATQVLSGPPTSPTNVTPAPDDEEEEGGRSKAWIWVLAILAVLLAGAITFLLTNRDPEPEPTPTPTMVEVPFIEPGSSQDEARAALEAVDLVPNFAEDAREPSAEYSEDTVIRTDPEAGTPVESGSSVLVVLSSGPDSFVMPEVEGWTQQQVQRELENLGWEGDLTVQTEDNGQWDVNRAIRTEPGADATVSVSDDVILYLSTGRVQVPALTQGMALEEAEQLIQEAGLNTRTGSMPSGDFPVGTVVDWDPKGIVERGTTITIYVATEPTETAVPTLTQGMALDEAERLLQEAGLNTRTETEVTGDWEPGTVVDWDPKGTVDRGTTITIYVAAAPEESPSPTPSPTGD